MKHGEAGSRSAISFGNGTLALPNKVISEYDLTI